MKDWFQALEAREQKFVLTAAIFVLFAVLYLAVWLPVDKGQEQVSASVEIWAEAVQQVGALKARVGQGGTPQVSQQNLNQPLVVVVDTTLRSRSLNGYLQRSQPTGASIRVEFEDVPFDDLVLWLGDISTQYALQVESGSFTGTGEEDRGLVNAQLTLGR